MQPKKVNILSLIWQREISLSLQQQQLSRRLITNNMSPSFPLILTPVSAVHLFHGRGRVYRPRGLQPGSDSQTYNLLMKWDLKRKYLGRFKWEPFKFLFCESFSSFSSFHEPQDNFE